MNIRRFGAKSSSGVVLIALLAMGTILSSCGLFDNREAKAHEYLQQKIASESQGAITLDRFTKTNGYDQDSLGTKMYVLEWQAQISFQAEGWKAGNALVGYWETFDVLTRQPGSLNSLVMGGATRFDKGTKVLLSGDSMFRKTDKGWRVEALTVKTSQILPDPEKERILNAFVGTWQYGSEKGVDSSGNNDPIGFLQIVRLKDDRFKLSEGQPDADRKSVV